MQIETFSQFYLAVAWDQHPEALPEESRMHPDPAVAAVCGRERERVCVCERESVCVCVCERERERVCGRERERVCVRERERESV